VAGCSGRIGQFATTPVIVLLKSIAGSLSRAIMVLVLLAGVVSAIVLVTGIGTRGRPATGGVSTTPTASVP
jgi:hypothetical protein